MQMLLEVMADRGQIFHQLGLLRGCTLPPSEQLGHSYQRESTDEEKIMDQAIRACSQRTAKDVARLLEKRPNQEVVIPILQGCEESRSHVHTGCVPRTLMQPGHKSLLGCVVGADHPEGFGS
jgi:hypothetical protein